MCYNAITSKKHSLFTMILYREIRLPKLLTADKNKATEALGAYQVKKQGEYTLEDYYTPFPPWLRISILRTTIISTIMMTAMIMEMALPKFHSPTVMNWFSIIFPMRKY